jgi:biofilm PGA synthesis N-glycosyltransferase PgaC
MLAKGYRIGYAENAFVFTNVPESYAQFYRQRKRWSRGLIEAFKLHPSVLIKPRFNTPFIYLNLLFPYLDMAFLLVLIPGVIAAVFFQIYIVVGFLTLILIPLILFVNAIMFTHQRAIFRRHGLKVRRNILGFLWYTVIYQFLMSPASLMGYSAELFNLRKQWGTK